jgi:hypothetical protein
MNPPTPRQTGLVMLAVLGLMLLGGAIARML